MKNSNSSTNLKSTSPPPLLSDRALRDSSPVFQRATLSQRWRAAPPPPIHGDPSTVHGVEISNNPSSQFKIIWISKISAYRRSIPVHILLGKVEQVSCYFVRQIKVGVKLYPNTRRTGSTHDLKDQIHARQYAETCLEQLYEFLAVLSSRRGHHTTGANFLGARKQQCT